METIPITGHTGLTCLLGQPVAHSVSPEMHNESFRYHGLDYVNLEAVVRLAFLRGICDNIQSHAHARKYVALNNSESCTCPQSNEHRKYRSSVTCRRKYLPI